MNKESIESRHCIKLMMKNERKGKRENPLPREQHEVRVQHDRQEEVRKDDGGKRPDGKELGDTPVPWHNASASDHAERHDDAEDEGVLEVLDDFADFLEEGGVFGLLAGRSPVHLDAEHVGQEGLR
jgi:hypothetical protein